MQIVIDITKEDYERLKPYGKAPFCSLTSRLYEAVANGILLPKGHGRITDMDEAVKCIKEVEGEDAALAICLIEWACSKRTIIEADTGSEEQE